jgi:hypothetical protein
MGLGNGPEFAEATDGAEVDETGQGLAESFVADMEAGAEVAARERSVGERGEDPMFVAPQLAASVRRADADLGRAARRGGVKLGSLKRRERLLDAIVAPALHPPVRSCNVSADARDAQVRPQSSAAGS